MSFCLSSLLGSFAIFTLRTTKMTPEALRHACTLQSKPKDTPTPKAQPFGKCLLYNSKQISSTPMQTTPNQQRRLTCGKGPAAALREGALATQAIRSKEPGGASRSRGGSAQEALTHFSRTPASRRCSSTRSPACNLAAQRHGSLSPQRPQRLWAPCLSGQAGAREPPHAAAFPSAPPGIDASHEATPTCLQRPLGSLLGHLGQLFSCAVRQSRASLAAGWQAASLGWREHYYLAAPRLPARTCGYLHMTAQKSFFSATRMVCKVNQCHAAANTWHLRVCDTSTRTQSILCSYPRIKFCFAVNKGKLHACVRGKIPIYTFRKWGGGTISE